MFSRSRWPLGLSAILVSLLGLSPVFGQERPQWQTPAPQAPEVAPASAEGEQALAGFSIPAGIEGALFAGEPDVANIVALHVDHQGRVWVCETFRQSKGIEDNRGHEHWLNDDLAAQTVQDRYDYIMRQIPDAATKYTEQDDRIRLLIDENGDRVADKATVFADRFNDVVAGTGAGVLSYRGDVFYTCIPDLWLLKDTDNDSVADERTSLHYGYGVRFAFRGHDMHGLTLGPDGRLYFSIGDRGYNVPATDGQGVNPESGAVFRCELDGSRLEVFAMGLRNPQELAFDEYGNLFTGDNNSDSGDQARWVHVVPGGDTGWRMSYQYLPDRGPFNRDKIWQPAHPGQPAYIVPPILNFADGPSGLTYYPGTGLGDEFKGRFLLCDFRGQASNSGIRSFRMAPKGAGFEMVDAEQPFWNILATDADFGPDGALYVADWVHGWEGLGKGRVYRFTDPTAAGSMIVKEVEQLLNSGMDLRDEEELTRLLGHVDRRIRQEAQFELARRSAFEALDAVARSRSSTLARIHALWGIGQIARRLERRDDAIETLAVVIRDKDAEVRAQACTVLGDLEDLTYADELARCLKDESPRVRARAAHAIGRLGYLAGLPGTLQLLMDNADADVFLRHAGIMALTGIGQVDRFSITSLESHPSASVRLAAVVALRKLSDAKVAAFLDDAEPLVAAEAARAVHDLPLTSALSELAASIDRSGDSVAMLHRALNANFRLGAEENAEALAAFVARASANEAMSVEALEMLGDWAEPNPRDRVLGMWRPLEPRSIEIARDALDRHLSAVLGRGGAVADKATDIASRLGIEAIIPRLEQRLVDEQLEPATRASALRALAQLKAPGLKEKVVAAASSDAMELRIAGVDLLVAIDVASAITALAQGIQSTETIERQASIASLMRCQSEEAHKLILLAGERLITGDLPADTQLDLVEALLALPNGLGNSTLDKYRSSLNSDDLLAEWRTTLAGGNVERGRVLFYERASLSCVRCHTIGGTGGQVGPNLSRIGLDKNAEYLLEAIVLPNQTIAKDFEGVLVQTLDGGSFSGIIKEETDEKLVLLNADGNLVTIPMEDVDQMVPGKSSMPEDLTKYLTKFELRDLIAFLAEQKTDPTAAGGHGEDR
jgi:quinoprotein glucose dehydrogenase